MRGLALAFGQFRPGARRSARAQLLAIAVCAALAAGGPAFAQTTGAAEPSQGAKVAVAVSNLSEPVLCAEKDNVTVAFQSDAVRSFRIEAAHPAYLAGLTQDSFAADWTSCDFAADPAVKSSVTVPTRKTLYEEPALWVVGWTFPTFWRDSGAKVRIGDRVFEGLHLVQVWMIRPMGGEEVLVFYPQDGYWRLRPRAPAGRDLTAFGSSILIGPVEDAGRPIVALDEVAFDPADKSFRLAFKAGGSARVVMSDVSDQRHLLDVSFDGPVSARPFAMIRSMYVTAFNNDAAAVAVRGKGAAGWQETPVMDFKGAEAEAVWIGRTVPSRHNTSSPDLVVQDFRGAVTGNGRAATTR